MLGPIAPLTIPLISPITSLQKFETCPAFQTSRIATFASSTLLDAIEWNGFSSAEVTATPIISKKTPVHTIKISTRNDNPTSKFSTNPSAIMLKNIARKNVHIVITIIHFILYLLKELLPFLLLIYNFTSTYPKKTSN